MIRAFQWDLARQVERFDWLLAQLPRYADWGYQELYLHLEDAVHYPSLPDVARRDAYSYRQMERLVQAATRVGIGVVPIVNLLGHTQYLIKVPALRDLNELRAADASPLPAGQICPLHPRTLEVAGQLLRDMAPFCTAGKVHVGLDESFHLGKHPRSQREIARVGRGAHFARYVQRLRQLIAGLGLRMGMWADMLYFLPEAIPLLPTDLIAYDWYYYPFKRRPKVELFNFAECDLAAPLQARGIEYWGCPMNGAFRHEPLPHFADRLENIRSWWRRCRAVGAGGMLITSWEPDRLAMETTTLVDAAAAGLWLSPGGASRPHLLRAGLRRLHGARGARVSPARLLQADGCAFSGYARWEINKAWKLASGPASLARYRRELRVLADLDRQARGWPPALAASLAFRRYLAERDVFVREARESVLRWRRAFAAGRDSADDVRGALEQATAFARQRARARRAARRMWQLTRRRGTVGPNIRILEQDRDQLGQWRTWLRGCLRDPAMLAAPHPLFGTWQLDYDVRNEAPAVQRVSVECFVEGAWQTIKSCHTIAFLGAEAVRRSGSIQRQTAVLPSGAREEDGWRLRLVVGGVGHVMAGNFRLTNGVRTYRALTGRFQRVGDPASASPGWPRLDQRSVLELDLRPSPGAAR